MDSDRATIKTIGNAIALLAIPMKNVSRILAIFIFFSVILLSLKLRSNPCELQLTSSEAISVQSRKRIYNKLFHHQACLPRKIVLGVPDNLKTQEGQPITFKGNQEAPKITTIVTITNKSNRFFIGRIDKIGEQWVYTKFDTCLAWKWTVENERQALYLTLERNLEIYANDLRSMILIISIPFELIETNPEIRVKPYTWNRVGGFYKLSFSAYPELGQVLKLVEEDNPNASDIFYPGKEVSASLAQELNHIDKMGGVHYNKELEQNMVQLDAQGYQASEQPGYCAVPQDLVDPKDPNTCKAESDK